MNWNALDAFAYAASLVVVALMSSAGMYGATAAVSALHALWPAIAILGVALLVTSASQREGP